MATGKALEQPIQAALVRAPGKRRRERTSRRLARTLAICEPRAYPELHVPHADLLSKLQRPFILDLSYGGRVNVEPSGE